MNRSELQDAIDRHGEDLSAWPLADRDRALEFLAREPESRSLFQDAAALRTALRDQPVIRAPAGLADRIVRAALGSNPAPTSETSRA
ncbi:hypothetical protein [Bosea sp. (in: a-proteobacteria)]|uniref:hypothetical protein n=1 Tax=Bosea sp. (in: a-proteobacteria) TaxID=1871050 RepID=UPI0040341D72